MESRQIAEDIKREESKAILYLELGMINPAYALYKGSEDIVPILGST
jgi:hypothetical protein